MRALQEYVNSKNGVRIMEKIPKGVIVPKVYEEKRARSLHFINSNGQRESIGVMMPYCYDFGEATVREEIFVISGALTSNGNVYTPDSPSIVFEIGQHIILECDEPVTYRCLYG